MMIKLENKYLVTAIEFLQGMSLKASESRARSKFVKLLSNALEELQESERELIKDFAELDAEGQPVSTDGGGTFTLKAGESPQEYSDQHSALMNELAEITGGTYANHIDKLQGILEGYQGELDGFDAEVYDRLLDAFEESKETEKGGAK